MSSSDRRKEIYKILSAAKAPVSASVLAEKFGVTRQIIVKDVGILKAEKKDVISTPKGYILNDAEKKGFTKLIRVRHGSGEMEDELKIIVDLGGRILNTTVNHPIYGVIGETLNIKSRKDIKVFLENIGESGCEPLLTLTNGVHNHIVEADDMETLDEICNELLKKEYLILE